MARLRGPPGSRELSSMLRGSASRWSSLYSSHLSLCIYCINICSSRHQFLSISYRIILSITILINKVGCLSLHSFHLIIPYLISILPPSTLTIFPHWPTIQSVSTPGKQYTSSAAACPGCQRTEWVQPRHSGKTKKFPKTSLFPSSGTHGSEADPVYLHQGKKSQNVQLSWINLFCVEMKLKRRLMYGT